MAAGKISIQANDGKVAGVVFEDGASSNVTVTIPKEGGVLATQDTLNNTISVPAAYHIYNGQLALANSVTTTGFSTTLYTGNGTTQSITTGVDMDTQWGNDASEKFGGLVWLKSRSLAAGNVLADTVRGAGNVISTNSTNAQTISSHITSFNSGGIAVGTTGQESNTNLATYASWNFQTTHRVSGVTNHGKAFTCHYNPFTGFTMVKYEGSGIAGHEIPHYLGRKLGFSTQKKLTAVGTWRVFADTITTASTSLRLDGADALYTDATLGYSSNDNSLVLSTNADYNASANQYVMYGWANSYFDGKSTLIGNYEIGVYQGTGVAGNKVTTRGKPAWVMIKRLDSAADWYIVDNQRVSGINDLLLKPNSSASELTGYDWLAFLSDGFSITYSDVNNNASGGQYLYMVVYDNDSGSGKSKYPRATDTSTLNLNAHVPFANGIDTTGSKVSIAYKNETITLSNGLAQGKNYIALLNDGSYVATPYEPMYSIRNRSKAGENPDYFDINSQKWYSTTGGSELVVNGTFDSNTNGWSVIDGVLSVENGSLKIATNSVNGAKAYTSFPTIVGTKYKLKMNVYLGTSANANLYVGTGIFVSDALARKDFSSSSKVEVEFTAISSTTYITVFNNTTTSGQTIYADNISVFESVPNLTPTTPRNYLDCIVYADQNGQPEYVEQIEKVQYFDAIKANDFRGKNACTAWVNFDGITTPPTIRDSYNVKSVVRAATGVYDIYFESPMDNANYVCTGMARDSEDDYPSVGIFRRLSDTKTTSVFRINTYYTSSAYNSNEVNIQIFGGRN